MNYVNFPAVNNANEDGLLAMGGDLSLDTLVSAYSQGIFPWFNQDQPILWWSPDPRLVLFPEQVRITKSLAKLLRQQRFRVSCNEQFEKVMQGCALRGSPPAFISNEQRPETWITDSMHQAYTALHVAGYAHSIEVWQGRDLVGGLYGVALGDVFFGESMFSAASNASKVALVELCRFLSIQGYRIIDCQVASGHLFSMGAKEIPRDDFLHYLSNLDIHQIQLNFAEQFNLSAGSSFDKP